MEEIDPNNPNLDGDFKALFRIREELKSKAAPKPSYLDPIPDDPEPASPQVDKNTSLKALVKSLLEAARTNNVDHLQKIKNDLSVVNHRLSSPAVRDPENNATALHIALQNKAFKTALYLIDNVNDSDYLTAEYDITVRNTASKKTSLHILVEYGNIDYITRLLHAIEPKQKQSYLLKETLMEVEGQRPRNFSAIHIAALKGHTDIVDLLQRLGVSVNLTNNKQDTPALWASRGNHIPTMRRLIQLKADLNHQNDKGSSPLYWAVRYGFTDMVKLLVQEGKADIHQQRKLGLVSPVVLAAALGYGEILTLLLNFGADANTKITNNQTALHFAASSGMDHILEILLRNPIDPDAADDTGNTPLHLATKNGHHSTMALLCSHGANVDARNKFGKTVWNMAMECKVPDVMKTVVSLYRRKKRLRGRKLIFEIGKTPMHEAASLGDLEKIEYLIQEGADPHAKDHHGNTFFHIAARENQIRILFAFLIDGDVNVTNKDGDTPMHLAAERGHLEAVEILIKKSRLDIKNNNQYTPLHKAVWSDAASPPVVRILIENIVKNNNWSLVDAVDHAANTALHVAAMRNHADIIVELGSLNPSCKNNHGDNPLHTAAKLGNVAVLEAMLDVFNKPGKGLNIDQQNDEGETLLHICSKTGNRELVEDLIEVGADLAKKNKQGNTVLHEIAEEIIVNPQRTQLLLVVFREIVECAPIWWCIKHDLPRADEGSDIYEQHKRAALVFLTSEVFNFEGYNVQGYSAKIGALALFEEMMKTEKIGKLTTGKHHVYDITNMTPDTVTEKRKKKTSKFSNPASVGVSSASVGNDAIIPSSESYLDIITGMSDEVLATKFLDVCPVKQISENLFNAYQWIYIILLIVHIVYMSCLTVYGIPAIAVVFNTTTESVKHTNPTTTFPFILFLLWPILIIIFGVFVLVSKVRRSLKMSKKQSKQSTNKFRLNDVPAAIISGLFNNLAEITAWVFSGLVIAWYVLYYLNDRNQVYVMTCVMVVGWMFTIVFTKGFQTVHAFSTMLSYIIVRDVTRFLMIYLFVLLGFAFAIHSLLQISTIESAKYPSTWDTLFLTFNLMIGMGDLFGDDFDESYSAAGSSATYVKVVYLVYMMLATIILLNLLIAMLSDTYNDIKSKEGTTWRVRSVQMAIRIERWLPFLKKIVVKTGAVDFSTTFDKESRRWLLKLPSTKTHDENENTVSEITKGLQRMEEKMTLMQSAYGDISDKLEEMMTQMQPLLLREQQSISPDSRGDLSSRPKTAGLRKRRTKNVLH